MEREAKLETDWVSDMSTRVGFFMVIGMLIGLTIFNFAFAAAGYGALLGLAAGFGLGLYLDRKDKRSS